MSKKEIEAKWDVDMEKAAVYFEELAKSMRTGTIYIRSSEEIVVLKPSKIIEIKVEACSKKHSEKIEIKMSWEKIQENGQDLTISPDKN
ncbi:MAG: amphi-Trp domain-containing protein [Candidatus Goldbacteria bacterium]|nr:amphi-Trp domain-containing protein [Candidatus Goldiibacteriota bacterium]